MEQGLLELSANPKCLPSFPNVALGAFILDSRSMVDVSLVGRIEKVFSSHDLDSRHFSRLWFHQQSPSCFGLIKISPNIRLYLLAYATMLSHNFTRLVKRVASEK